MAIDHSEALLTLESFAQKFENKLVKIPGLDGPVYCRPLTVAEADKLARYSANEYNARLLVTCCVDEAGKPLFMETDIPRLLRLPVGIVADAAYEVSGHITANFDAIKNS